MQSLSAYDRFTLSKKFGVSDALAGVRKVDHTEKAALFSKLLTLPLTLTLPLFMLSFNVY